MGVLPVLAGSKARYLPCRCGGTEGSVALKSRMCSSYTLVSTASAWQHGAVRPGPDARICGQVLLGYTDLYLCKVHSDRDVALKSRMWSSYTLVSTASAWRYGAVTDSVRPEPNARICGQVLFRYTDLYLCKACDMQWPGCAADGDIR